MTPSEFLHELYPNDIPDGLYLLIWTLPGKKSYWSTSIDDAVAVIGSLPRRTNVYVGCGLSPRDYGPNKRCPANEIAGTPGFWADIDIASPAHKKKNLPPTVGDAVALARDAIGMEPSIVVHSGHGIHVWWRYKTPYVFDDSDARDNEALILRGVTDLLRDEAKKHGWDCDSTHDLSRVLRVPGTMNYKRGLSPVEVQVIDID